MTVGETVMVTVEDAKRYAGFNENELNMVFHFEHMGLDGGDNSKWGTRRVRLEDLKRVLNHWQTGLDGTAWNSLYWDNHDQPRVVSRFGNDSNAFFREKSAKMLATCLHMMQGTIYVYQGEELGMTNVRFPFLGDYRDIQTLRMYDERVNQMGLDPQNVMEAIYFMSRDNGRTPMQWDDGKNAGFSSAEPWIKVNPNYQEINVADQKDDPDSVLSYYRKLIRLRKKYDIIVYGNYQPLLEGDENIFAYIRKLDSQRLLVLCNFTSGDQGFPADMETGALLICNYSEPGMSVLRPYEARVYLCL
jgi:oligo-1,6-glucosidase